MKKSLTPESDEPVNGCYKLDSSSLKRWKDFLVRRIYCLELGFMLEDEEN